MPRIKPQSLIENYYTKGLARPGAQKSQGFEAGDAIESVKQHLFEFSERPLDASTADRLTSLLDSIFLHDDDEIKSETQKLLAEFQRVAPDIQQTFGRIPTGIIERIELKDHARELDRSYFVEGHRKVLSASEKGSIFIHGLDTGALEHEIEERGFRPYGEVFFDHARGRVIASGIKSVGIMSLDNDKELQIQHSVHTQEITRCLLMPNQEDVILMSGDGTFSIHNIESDDTTLHIDIGKYIYDGALSQDGQELTVALEGGDVEVYSTKNGDMLASYSVSDADVTSVFLNKHGTKILASGSEDAAFYIDRNKRKGVQRLNAPGRYVDELRFNHSQTHMTLVSGGSARLFSAGSAQWLYEVKKSDEDWVKTATVSSDGTKLYVGTSQGHIRMIDVWNDKEILSQKMSSEGIKRLELNEKEDRLIVSYFDGTAEVVVLDFQ